MSIASELRLYLCNHWVNAIPSHSIREAFYRQVMGFDIPQGASLLMGLRFTAAKGFSIQPGSVINQHCHLDTRGGITIGASVSISPEVMILTADHDIDSPEFSGRDRPVVVEDFVFIGSRALILPGVTLARGSVVAAGSVVTRSTEPYSVVGGAPAKHIRRREAELTYSLHYRRRFH